MQIQLNIDLLFQNILLTQRQKHKNTKRQKDKKAKRQKGKKAKRQKDDKKIRKKDKKTRQSTFYDILRYFMTFRTVFGILQNFTTFNETL